MNQLDHFVYCVPNLEEAIDYFKNKIGMNPIIGGRHENFGTRNAILNLGNLCYLELLAIDHSIEIKERNRWMGIDFIKEPKITRWACRSNKLDEDSEVLKTYNPNLGKRIQGSRMKPNGDQLKWEMTLPYSSPEVELMPFFIDWLSLETHPTNGIPEAGKIANLELTHPNPRELSACFKKLKINLPIRKGEQSSIRLEIEGPKGKFKI